MPNPANPNYFIVDMEPVGRRSEVESGTTLLDAARSAGVGLVSLCGGEGWCEMLGAAGVAAYPLI
jgi:uncharacterized 2Fe-2S/4Fe-4S cluster protein (DUF4445 family)